MLMTILTALRKKKGGMVNMKEEGSDEYINDYEFWREKRIQFMIDNDPDYFKHNHATSLFDSFFCQQDTQKIYSTPWRESYKPPQEKY